MARYNGHRTNSDGCDGLEDSLVHHLETDFRHLAWHIAWWLDENHDADAPVDVVAHSMGGLLVRYAMLQSELTKGTDADGMWPDSLPIENLVTLGTPHAGVLLACGPGGAVGRILYLLTVPYQARQMCPYSEAMKWLRSHPDAPHQREGDAWATSWTVVGSVKDEVVSWTSATSLGYVTRVVYDSVERSGRDETCSTPIDYLHEVYYREDRGIRDACYWYDPGSDEQEGWFYAGEGRHGIPLSFSAVRYGGT